jgi:PTH1 family peptidyl-tRNA hydrolase
MRIRILRSLRRFFPSRALSYEHCDKLVLGLGNPGRRYASTRHNAGFQALDLLAARESLAWRAGRGDFHAVRWRYTGGEALLAKPTTFMNLSGRAGARLLELTRLAPEDCLVVVDDIDLPLGRLRLRDRGGSGGHRGLASLIELWGTETFPRLRLGVGRPDDSTSDHVLGDYAEEELDTVKEMLDAAAQAISEVLEKGMGGAMGRFNAKPRV